MILEQKKNGILLGETICQKPFEKPQKSSAPQLKQNEVELIRRFLEEKAMVVDTVALIERHRQGLSLSVAKVIVVSSASSMNMSSWIQGGKSSPMDKLPWL